MAQGEGKNTKAIQLQSLYELVDKSYIFALYWKTYFTIHSNSGFICLFNPRICPFICMGKGNPQQTLKQGS